MSCYEPIAYSSCIWRTGTAVNQSWNDVLESLIIGSGYGS